MPAPEELARQNIDKLLTACGWIIQKRSKSNLNAGRGIAITDEQGRPLFNKRLPILEKFS